ncbi:MAG: response regulator, partial [Anaerolineae bacterium]|nr:response regulator [Anaerolineae bacterium]
MMNSANRHILITDDNPTNIILLDRLIQRMGHRTTHAETGEEAIRLLERDTFDLVLLDIMLPGMTGFQVLEWIRERHSLDSLPVIM